MGTNYYVCTRDLPDIEPESLLSILSADSIHSRIGWRILHVGKSSAGWCFALHVIPEFGLNSWEAWLEFLRSNADVLWLYDEYDDDVTLAEFIEVVTNRVGVTNVVEERHDKEWLRRNQAEPGPNGLAKCKIGQYCCGHGSGTWDLMPGNFS